MTAPTCPYCGQPSLLVDGTVIYPHRHDLAQKKFYQCSPCDAYVGCHPKAAPNGMGGFGDGTVPLGRLANAELRRAKAAAHAAFDPLWRFDGMRRRDAYGWLAKALGIPTQDCHIGLFDVTQCEAVISVVKAKVSQ